MNMMYEERVEGLNGQSKRCDAKTILRLDYAWLGLDAMQPGVKNSSS